MPWYEYSVRPDGPPLPLVEVLLWNGAQRVRLVALVDSGADGSLLDVGYADAVGLNRDDAEEITSVTASGAEMTCLRWPHAPLELQFETYRFPFKGAFAEFPPDADGTNLMGRRDFFDMFIIQFWNAAEMVSIDLSPDFAKPAPP
jgi:hypothetical protein